MLLSVEVLQFNVAVPETTVCNPEWNAELPMAYNLIAPNFKSPTP